MPYKDDIFLFDIHFPAMILELLVFIFSLIIAITIFFKWKFGFKMLKSLKKDTDINIIPFKYNDLKKKIRSAQLKAAVKVNQELLTLYWEIG